MKRDLDKILVNLLENALNKDGNVNEEINKKISIVLSSKVFY
jgi:C4-dicarboxylate-specific signal transduction histidine kinase